MSGTDTACVKNVFQRQAGNGSSSTLPPSAQPCLRQYATHLSWRYGPTPALRDVRYANCYEGGACSYAGARGCAELTLPAVRSEAEPGREQAQGTAVSILPA
eukprot:3940340-Rhodomonas_salina.6